MAAALSRAKTSFLSKRIGVGSGEWGGHQGRAGGGVSVNPQGSQLHCHCSMAPIPFTQHSTVHNRSYK